MMPQRRFLCGAVGQETPRTWAAALQPVAASAGVHTLAVALVRLPTSGQRLREVLARATAGKG